MLFPIVGLIIFLLFSSCAPQNTSRQLVSQEQNNQLINSSNNNSSSYSIPIISIKKIRDSYDNETPYVLIHQNTSLGLNAPHYIQVKACPSDPFYCQTGIKVGSDASASMPGAQLVAEIPGLPIGNSTISVSACKDIEDNDHVTSSCGIENSINYTQEAFITNLPLLKKQEKEMFPKFETVAQSLTKALKSYKENAKTCTNANYATLKSLPDDFIRTYLDKYTPFERAKALSTGSLQLLVNKKEDGSRHLTLVMNANIFDMSFLKEVVEATSGETSTDGDTNDLDETKEATIEGAFTLLGTGAGVAGLKAGIADLKKSFATESTLTDLQKYFTDKTEAIFKKVQLNGKNINTDKKTDFSKSQVKEILEKSANMNQDSFVKDMMPKMTEEDSKKIWKNLEELKTQAAESGKFKDIKNKSDLDKLLAGDLGIKNDDVLSRSINKLFEGLPIQKAKGSLGKIQESKIIGGAKIAVSGALIIASIAGGSVGINESVVEIIEEEVGLLGLTGDTDCEDLKDSVEKILDTGEDIQELQLESKQIKDNIDQY
jgi:hypothetical protein